ncbi:UDP-2,4-diacetamido-2,4,6-trideoxy-beta-L-altropyranose hydrolase [Campylobacter concisus]|uniref:UDP-2,4-diacetamido-2,4, 6-trideoxy-beta-L-altropyranose hydrolase n=1 Tax=Campylobacter concisus TaxID=199 RepID=UPI00122CC6F2|nr:UDP-2,4-diacetamido-2,4,6-trideoxy-beta-L-altropyranose hydrolase [Campylobacter concisus]
MKEFKGLPLLKTLVRADSSSKIGHGHIRRDLLLAKKFSDISFASLRLEGDIFDEINYSKFSLRSGEIDELCELIKDNKFKLLIIDHYGFSFDDERAIKEKTGVKILSFDDTYEKHFADYILNVNLYAQKARYEELVEKDCEVFCGSEFLLVRDEFYEEAQVKREKIYDYAIILGGTDISGLSAKISKKLLLKGLKTAVITTSGNKNLSALKELASKNENFSLFVDNKNVARLMSEAKMLIITASSLVNEAYVLGAKFKAICVADNQKEIFTWLKENGYEAYLGDEICLSL